MTLEQVKALRIGQIVYEHAALNADGTPLRWRVNGKIKLWKRTPNRVRVPVKNGLWNHAYITEYNMQHLSLM